MELTLSQKLNIIKSNKSFINYTLDSNNKLINYTLNDNYLRYKNQYQTFKLLDIFTQDNIYSSKQNYTLKQILTTLNIN